MINIIFIGAPGSGKGTQAELIKRDFNISHISTGDMFRENISNNTELGKTAKSFMDKGELVPDEITIKMLNERISADDCKKGFMLDGYPRTVEQAKALDEMLKKLNIKLSAIIHLHTSDEIIIKRLLNRARADDNEATIKNRLQVFKNQSEPVLDYYKSSVKIIKVKSVGNPDDVHAVISKELKSL